MTNYNLKQFVLIQNCFSQDICNLKFSSYNNLKEMKIEIHLFLKGEMQEQGEIVFASLLTHSAEF